MDIYSKLDELGEYIEQAKILPIINQKVLDADYIMQCLQDIYACIPQEIEDGKSIKAEQATREAELHQNAEELMQRTKAECEKLMTEARNNAEKLLNEDEIRAQAEAEAKGIQKEVVEEAERVRREVMDEVDEIRRRTIDQARELEARAQERAQRIKTDADRYAEEILNQIDGNISQIQSINKNGRKFLADLKEKDLLEL